MPDGDSGAQQDTSEKNVPVAMRRVHRQLQRWRRHRQGRERIPAALWAAAGKLAREHGVNQVSQALRLEFNQLKRAAEAVGAKRTNQATPAFVELIAPEAPSGRQCALELEGPRGKLRVELKGMAPAELADITRALWEMLG